MIREKGWMDEGEGVRDDICRESTRDGGGHEG